MAKISTRRFDRRLGSELFGTRGRCSPQPAATIRLANGTIRGAEVHWYEAHGVGRVRLKIERSLD